jgi:hypothetical protein
LRLDPKVAAQDFIVRFGVAGDESMNEYFIERVGRFRHLAQAVLKATHSNIACVYAGFTVSLELGLACDLERPH